MLDSPAMKKHFALIGHPLGHSLSPEIHAAIMAAAGIDGDYTLLDIPPADLPSRLSSLLADLDGFNVTIPHKKTVIPFLATLSPSARRCGAVNTVARPAAGHNTDTAGFLAAGLPLRGARVLLLGTGGVAAMMAAETLAAGADTLAVSTRAPARGETFLADLRARFPGTSCRLSTVTGEDATAEALAASTILLNGTPVGMWPRAGGIPVPPESLHSSLAVFDPVYSPTPTRLVLNARKHGARAVSGLPMLVHQALAAQKIWNPGIALDADVLASGLIPRLAATLWKKNPANLLLTGFMGAGKTTVGRELAKRLRLPFIDLDAEIVRAAGRPIPAIFADSGEAAFRTIERDTARRILEGPSSCVIASGGGFPLAAENRALVRSTNTLVLNIDAPFGTLWRRIAGHPGRPLARTVDATAALHATRAPVYASFCDFSVTTSNNAPPSATTSRIASAFLDALSP